MCLKHLQGSCVLLQLSFLLPGHPEAIGHAQHSWEDSYKLRSSSRLPWEAWAMKALQLLPSHTGEEVSVSPLPGHQEQVELEDLGETRWAKLEEQIAAVGPLTALSVHPQLESCLGGVCIPVSLQSIWPLLATLPFALPHNLSHPKVVL